MSREQNILLKSLPISISQDALSAYCRRWKVSELALFGSVLDDDFGPDSDVDVLVTFAPDARWTLLDHVQMQAELKQLLGREVDLVSRRGIENSRNPIRREEILNTAQVVYAVP